MRIYLGTWVILLLITGCTNRKDNLNVNEKIRFPEVSQVIVKDYFWAPRMELWNKITACDVLNKFEGKHIPDLTKRAENDAFRNFDLVAAGERGIGKHAGFPWFDGLIYETIRGIADLLVRFDNEELEQRVDAYIERIDAAQRTEPTGYIETYTQLMEPGHQWGENGGFLRWQHDVYNAGMLVEAGVHYYKATGKTRLLNIATRFANYMCDYMGPEPKNQVVPSHSGPEEAMMKLYWLYRNEPGLKDRMEVPVNENSYYELVRYWIENRGNHCGYPLWITWGNGESEKWIKEQKYKDLQSGSYSRPSWGDYAQDSISVFRQKTIEGHAVRATLLATGIATVALENRSPQYIETAGDLWENMVGKRMFVTGGVGAIHHDEKFGPDYFLPTDAYLETCAAVGAGFFSQRMNELTGDARYMDEFERVLYNNVLTGISLTGTRYTYQNPLNAHQHNRWEWHECPCCPPMFLKIVSALPGYIYSFKTDTVFVNLFISSEVQVDINESTTVRLKQETGYPWDGNVLLTVMPGKESDFAVKIRIPGWAQGIENPFGLYYSDLSASVQLKVNNELVDMNIENGYAVIGRRWEKDDRIELSLPVQPRRIRANDRVAALKDMVTLASGPLIYCLEACDNSNLQDIRFADLSSLKCEHRSDLLYGVNVITGTVPDTNRKQMPVLAIPYFAVGNREQGGGYKVWIPE